MIAEVQGVPEATYPPDQFIGLPANDEVASGIVTELLSTMARRGLRARRFTYLSLITDLAVRVSGLVSKDMRDLASLTTKDGVFVRPRRRHNLHLLVIAELVRRISLNPVPRFLVSRA